METLLASGAIVLRVVNYLRDRRRLNAELIGVLETTYEELRMLIRLLRLYDQAGSGRTYGEESSSTEGEVTLPSAETTETGDAQHADTTDVADDVDKVDPSATVANDPNAANTRAAAAHFSNAAPSAAGAGNAEDDAAILQELRNDLMALITDFRRTGDQSRNEDGALDGELQNLVAVKLERVLERALRLLDQLNGPMWRRNNPRIREQIAECVELSQRMCYCITVYQAMGTARILNIVSRLQESASPQSAELIPLLSRLTAQLENISGGWKELTSDQLMATRQLDLTLHTLVLNVNKTGASQRVFVQFTTALRQIYGDRVRMNPKGPGAVIETSLDFPPNELQVDCAAGRSRVAAVHIDLIGHPVTMHANASAVYLHNAHELMDSGVLMLVLDLSLFAHPREVVQLLWQRRGVGPEPTNDGYMGSLVQLNCENVHIIVSNTCTGWEKEGELNCAKELQRGMNEYIKNAEDSTLYFLQVTILLVSSETSNEESGRAKPTIKVLGGDCGIGQFQEWFESTFLGSQVLPHRLSILTGGLPRNKFLDRTARAYIRASEGRHTSQGNPSTTSEEEYADEFHVEVVEEPANRRYSAPGDRNDGRCHIL